MKRSSNYHGMKTQTLHLQLCQSPLTSPKADLLKIWKGLTVIPAAKLLHWIRISFKIYRPPLKINQPHIYAYNKTKHSRTWSLRYIPYLSDQTSIKRLSSTLWITDKWLISKVMQVTSSHKTITAIVSRATNREDTIILAWFIDLPNKIETQA